MPLPPWAVAFETRACRPSFFLYSTLLCFLSNSMTQSKEKTACFQPGLYAFIFSVVNIVLYYEKLTCMVNVTFRKIRNKKPDIIQMTTYTKMLTALCSLAWNTSPSMVFLSKIKSQIKYSLIFDIVPTNYFA